LLKLAKQVSFLFRQRFSEKRVGSDYTTGALNEFRFELLKLAKQVSFLFRQRFS